MPWFNAGANTHTELQNNTLQLFFPQFARSVWMFRFCFQHTLIQCKALWNLFCWIFFQVCSNFRVKVTRPNDSLIAAQIPHNHFFLHSFVGSFVHFSLAWFGCNGSHCKLRCKHFSSISVLFFLSLANRMFAFRPKHFYIEMIIKFSVIQWNSKAKTSCSKAFFSVFIISFLNELETDNFHRVKVTLKLDISHLTRCVKTVQEKKYNVNTNSTQCWQIHTYMQWVRESKSERKKERIIDPREKKTRSTIFGVFVCPKKGVQSCCAVLRFE